MIMKLNPLILVHGMQRLWLGGQEARLSLSSEMTYTVSSGTLNSSIPYQQIWV